MKSITTFTEVEQRILYIAPLLENLTSDVDDFYFIIIHLWDFYPTFLPQEDPKLGYNKENHTIL